MKLAEALIERADIQKKIEQLRSRLCANALVQEGESPSEEPSALLIELDALMKRYCTLVAQINLTNAKSFLDGVTMTEMLAIRETLTKKLSVLRDFHSNSSITVQRTRISEIKIKSAVNVAELQNEIDRISKQLRETETKIQAANWTTDLVE